MRTWAMKRRRFYTAGGYDLAEVLDPPEEWLRAHVRAVRLEPSRPIGPIVREPQTANWSPCEKCGAPRTHHDRKAEATDPALCTPCNQARDTYLMRRAEVAKRLEAEARNRHVVGTERTRSHWSGRERQWTSPWRGIPCACCDKEIHSAEVTVLLANAKTFVFHRSCWTGRQHRLGWLVCWALGIHIDTPSEVPDPDEALAMLEAERDRRKSVPVG